VLIPQVVHYHEAGHVVIADLLGWVVRGSACGFSGGFTDADPPDDGEWRWRQKALITLAGDAAEARCPASPNRFMQAEDEREVARSTVAEHVADAEGELRALDEELDDLLAQTQLWARVEIIARALFDQRQLTGAAVAGLLHGDTTARG
jgi:hypothetical protein